jgi:ABC-type Na+ efflux pump permease subunit
MRDRVAASLVAQGMPSARANAEAAALSQSHAGTGSVASIPHFFRIDFAYSTQTVLYLMAGVMAVAAVVAIIGLRAGAQQEAADTAKADPGLTPRGMPGTDDPEPAS